MEQENKKKFCYDYALPSVAADCVVFGYDESNINILLIQRGEEPFKGKWALPGGFLRTDEDEKPYDKTIEECATRELLEETGLNIERIEQLGAKLYFGFMAGVKGTDSFDLINNAIDAKCKTLSKGGYRDFKEYHLFLFSSIYAVDDMLREELQYLIANDIGKFYRVIYILVPGSMYCFDLKTGIYKTFDIDSNKQFEHATQARRMVLEGEEDARRI